MKVFSFVSVFALLGALASPAAAAPQDTNTCFHESTIDGWTYVDKDTVRVSVGPSRAFELKIMGNARELAMTENLGIKSSPSGWICEGSGLGLEIFSRDTIPRHWAVIGVKAVPKAP